MDIDGWAAAIRAAREEAGLTQTALAARAGVSASAVTRYERGERQPRGQHARALAEAFESPTREHLLAEFGLGPDPVVKPFEVRRLSAFDASAQIDAYAWPCLLNNEYFEVLDWNRSAESVAELHFPSDLTDDYHRHYLLMACMPHFRERLLNWNEVIGHMVGLWRLDFPDPIQAVAQIPLLGAVLGQLATRYPEAFLSLEEMWRSMPLFVEGGRNGVPVQWRASDGTSLKFYMVFRSWSEYDGVFCADWHPQDSATWAWLDQRRTGSVDPTTEERSVRIGPDWTLEWSKLLRSVRERLQLDRGRAAELSGVAEDTIYSFEVGRRTPSRTQVIALTKRLGADSATTNCILEKLDLAPEPSGHVQWICGLPLTRDSRAPVHALSNRTLPQVLTEATKIPWPCFIFDAGCELVGMNQAAANVSGLSFDRSPLSEGAHLLDIVASTEFRDHTRNWRDVVNVLLPSSVKPFLNPTRVRPTSRAFRAAVERVRTTRPGVLESIAAGWLPSEKGESARIAFDLEWLAPDGAQLRFNCLISNWNAVDPWWAIDWHPANAETWRWFETRE